MKLTTAHIGKKMRRSTWGMHSFFIPLARASNGNWIGECAEGRLDSYPEESSTWEFFEEPEEEIKLEIKLWSVWEDPEVGDLLFITKIEDEWFYYFLPDGFIARTNKMSEVEFNFKPRPDLEVVAPALVKEGQLLWQSNFLYSKEASIPDLYKWPASLALCQIVEKKK